MLLLPSVVFGQKLPRNFTCQDLIDSADGKASRSNDGGRTYVPINAPRPRDNFGQALLDHDTYFCRKLQRGEIDVNEFDARHAEKVHQLSLEREKALAHRRALENQERALRNQEQALQNQEQAIQTQKEAVQVQRQSVIIHTLQAEAARRQQAIQHQEMLRQQQIHQQIQQQQLEQIRQELARPKSLSCFGGGSYIHCN
jgi:hypothetical protein